MTWLSVDFPEPFGPMMAWTSPLFTVSDRPWRISRSSTRTCRFLTSSSDILIYPSRHPEVRADFGEARRMIFRLGCHPLRLASQAPQDDDLYPTDPSRLIEISFCASTANSIGSCCSTSLTKPLTTKPTASSWLSPRCTQ